MNKTKKRIVALSTAFAMAFVMVASLVLGFTSKADDTVNPLIFTFTPPTTGTSYSSRPTCEDAMKGCVTVTSQGATCTKVVLCKENGDDVEYPTAALDADTDYYAYIQFKSASGMVFSRSDTAVTCSSGADIVDASMANSTDTYRGIRVKFKTSTATTTIDSIGMTVTSPKVDSTMTFDGQTKLDVKLPSGANYSIGDGAFYMDKTEVDAIISGQMAAPATDPVTVKDGDVFYAMVNLKANDGYQFDVTEGTGGRGTLNTTPSISGADLYGVGAYASKQNVSIFVKVKASAGSSETPDDPVKPSDTPAATQDTTTATPTTAAATPTTTKAAVPKTGDNIPYVAIGLVIFGMSVGGVVLYRRHKRF